MLMTHVDLIEKLLNYNAQAQVRQRQPTVRAGSPVAVSQHMRGCCMAMPVWLGLCV